MNKPIRYQAAGGVVVRENGVWFLLLERPGRRELRLPKGHIEPGETREQAAVREVQEETGYAEVTIVADLGSYTHTFYDYLKDREVTRTESYFLMQLDSEQTYTGPQYAHENFQRKWVKRDEAERLTTYESEREFIRRARRALAQQA
ncbi:MAG: NUDIX domain-containing protein [Chloroflexi bacterium]|nr:NUDIX domain-containing protein [Chloroflexota bacterium]